MPDKDSVIKRMHDEQAKALLAAIVDSSDDAIISKTLDGEVTSWNRGAELLYGYSQQEALGRRISFIVPAERLEELRQISERIRQGERVEHLETVRVTRDGRHVFVSLTLSPIMGNHSTIIGISTIARDISERVRMEAALRESEKRYRTMVEMAPDAVVVHQEERFVYANCAALGIFGARSLEELQLTSLLDLVHPDDRESVRERLQLLLDGEEIPLREFRLLRLDGEELSVETTSIVIDYHGKPSIQIIARDITERKRAEKERESLLRELDFERARFQAVVQQMPVGVMIAAAPGGRVIYDNDRSREIFRQGETPLTDDLGHWDLFAPDGSPLPVEAYPLSRALRGESVAGVELQIGRGDGTRGYVSINAGPIVDQRGEIVAGLAAYSDISEEKLALQALSESEQRLNLALQAAEMGSCDMEVESGRGVWSSRHFLLLGYPAPQALSGPAEIAMWLGRVHGEDREQVLRELEEARGGRTFFRSEHRIVRADDGKELWVNVMGRFICDNGGGACRFIGVIFDVSERKAAEQALQNSERRFRLMADSLPQIIWTAKPDGSLDYINAHFEEYTGIRRDSPLVRANLEHPERLIEEVVHPEEAPQIIGDWRHTVTTGEIYQSEARLRRCDGAYRWHLSRAIPERDELGRIVMWYGAATDINDLRQTQQALRTSEATLKSAIETGGIGIFDWDLRSGRHDWSDIAKSHYGLPPEVAMTHELFLSAVHPEDREYMELAIRQATNPEGAGEFGAEYRTVGVADGKLRWLSSRGRVFFDENRLPLRMVGACLDISSIVQAEKALKEEIAERLRAVEELRKQEQLLIRQGRLAAMGEMIANIAHQWRQPLNTLGLIVQELPRFYELNLFSKEYLDASVARAMQVINHMSKTIDGFRNFFGPNREKETFQASEVLRRTVSIVEAAFNELSLKIEVEADPELELYGLPNEFSQVILNVLVNAKDALIERKVAQPRVTVRLFRENGKGVLTIADNAGGIPPEIIDKIFDPYFTTKGPDKGTGIGLFMSKTIIEKNMGGSLWVQNTAEGAEFRIEI